jgi:hypothetical protein
MLSMELLFISIIKPQVGAFAKNYYYHKTRGYSIVAQVIINCNKKNYEQFCGPSNTQGYCASLFCMRKPNIMGCLNLVHDLKMGSPLTF